MYSFRFWITPIVVVLLVESYAVLSTDDNGFRVHVVDSEYQAGKTTIRTLLPDDFNANKNYRVLYVLPVVAKDDRRHGDGLLEVKKLDFHNQHHLICVSPEFTEMPWFADHDQNPRQRDESHFLKVVLPFIEKTYPVIESKEGRVLLGFSKSGWGAFTLLFRNPEVFHRAAGWDTGIRVDTGPIEEEDRMERISQNFGSRSNFETYRITNLIRDRGAALGEETRIFYYNTEGKRAAGGVKIHELMMDEGIPHRYLFEPKRTHRWDSGWIPQAVEFLVGGG